MKTSSVYKYGNDVIWSLPCLFQYEVVFGAIQSTLQELEFQPLNANIFGSPATNWSSGRAPVVVDKLEKRQLKKIFNYIQNTHKGAPSFTFSKIEISKDELKSEYENYILDLAIETGARFIVSSDRLKDYIKEKSPNSVVVASILKPIYRYQGKTKLEEATPEGESEYYNKLLKEYDIVVARPEYTKDVLVYHPELIDDISRIEVLINQICTSNCPSAPIHYNILQKSHIEDIEQEKMYCYKTLYSPIQKYTLNSAHTEEEVKKLIEYGVRHLKLQGRGEKVSHLRNTFFLASQIFNFDGANNLFAIMLMNDALRNEYKKFSAIVDPQGLWNFQNSSEGLV